MTSPRSVRLDESVSARLRSFAARHGGVSSSAVVARLVDEGLRMEEHPGVVFREGPIGRRASLVGGPDVWQVIQAVRSGREAEPGLDEAALLGMISDNTGVPMRLVRTAVDYWADYPDEVEVLLAHADRKATELAEADHRKRRLLGT